MSTKQIVPADLALPNKLYVLPVQGKPIFPGVFTPLILPSEEEVKVALKVMEGDSIIGLLLTRSEEFSETPTRDFYNVGTVAKIVRKINLPDGGINVFISTLKRFKIKKYLQEDPPFVAAVQYLDDER